MLLLAGLVDEGLVDVRQHTTTGDGSLDEGIQLLVTTDGQLKMARRDTLHLTVLRDVSRQLKNLSGEVLQDSRSIDCGSGSYSLLGGDAGLEEAVDTANGELREQRNEKSV